MVTVSVAPIIKSEFPTPTTRLELGRTGKSNVPLDPTVTLSE